MFKIFHRGHKVQFNEKELNTRESKDNKQQQHQQQQRHSSFYTNDELPSNDTSKTTTSTAKINPQASKSSISNSLPSKRHNNLRNVPQAAIQSKPVENEVSDEETDPNGLRQKIRNRYTSVTTLLMRSFRNAKEKKKKETDKKKPDEHDQSSAIYRPFNSDYIPRNTTPSKINNNESRNSIATSTLAKSTKTNYAPVINKNKVETINGHNNNDDGDEDENNINEENEEEDDDEEDADAVPICVGVKLISDDFAVNHPMKSNEIKIATNNNTSTKTQEIKPPAINVTGTGNSKVTNKTETTKENVTTEKYVSSLVVDGIKNTKDTLETSNKPSTMTNGNNKYPSLTKQKPINGNLISSKAAYFNSLSKKTASEIIIDNNKDSQTLNRPFKKDKIATNNQLSDNQSNLKKETFQSLSYLPGSKTMQEPNSIKNTEATSNLSVNDELITKNGVTVKRSKTFTQQLSELLDQYKQVTGASNTSINNGNKQESMAKQKLLIKKFESQIKNTNGTSNNNSPALNSKQAPKIYNREQSNTTVTSTDNNSINSNTSSENSKTNYNKQNKSNYTSFSANSAKPALKKYMEAEQTGFKKQEIVTKRETEAEVARTKYIENVNSIVARHRKTFETKNGNDSDDSNKISSSSGGSNKDENEKPDKIINYNRKSSLSPGRVSLTESEYYTYSSIHSPFKTKDEAKLGKAQRDSNFSSNSQINSIFKRELNRHKLKRSDYSTNSNTENESESVYGGNKGKIFSRAFYGDLRHKMKRDSFITTVSDVDGYKEDTDLDDYMDMNSRRRSSIILSNNNLKDDAEMLHSRISKAETSDDFKALVTVLEKQDIEFKIRFFNCLMPKLWDSNLPYDEYLQLNKLMTALFGEKYHELDESTRNLSNLFRAKTSTNSIDQNIRKEISKAFQENIKRLVDDYLNFCSTNQTNNYSTLSKGSISNDRIYRNEQAYPSVDHLINTLKRRQKRDFSVDSNTSDKRRPPSTSYLSKKDTSDIDDYYDIYADLSPYARPKSIKDNMQPKITYTTQYSKNSSSKSSLLLHLQPQTDDNDDDVAYVIDGSEVHTLPHRKPIKKLEPITQNDVKYRNKTNETNAIREKIRSSLQTFGLDESPKPQHNQSKNVYDIISTFNDKSKKNQTIGYSSQLLSTRKLQVRRPSVPDIVVESILDQKQQEEVKVTSFQPCVNFQNLQTNRLNSSSMHSNSSDSKNSTVRSTNILPSNGTLLQVYKPKLLQQSPRTRESSPAPRDVVSKSFVNNKVNFNENDFYKNVKNELSDSSVSQLNNAINTINTIREKHKSVTPDILKNFTRINHMSHTENGDNDYYESIEKNERIINITNNNNNNTKNHESSCIDDSEYETYIKRKQSFLMEQQLINSFNDYYKTKGNISSGSNNSLKEKKKRTVVDKSIIDNINNNSNNNSTSNGNSNVKPLKIESYFESKLYDALY